MDDFSSKKLIKDVDSIKRSLVSMDKTLALNTQSLIEHIKRTDALEDKIIPLEKSYEQFIGIMKFLGFLAVMTTIASIWMYFKG